MHAAVLILTLAHVAVSLVGLVAGCVVLAGLFRRQQLDWWTSLFLWTTAATSASGFLFPVDRILPSHVLGVISLLVLGAAYAARYRYAMRGAWRAVYAATAVASLYLNVFVLIVQLFLKVPALHQLAPTQAEPPFAIAQGITLLAFIALGVMATLRFKAPPVETSAPAG
jgi:hypothetical protein